MIEWGRTDIYTGNDITLPVAYSSHYQCAIEPGSTFGYTCETSYWTHSLMSFKVYLSISGSTNVSWISAGY